MQVFETTIKKDESGRLTVIELPFNAKEVFHKSKGTIFVSGTINNTSIGVNYSLVVTESLLWFWIRRYKSPSAFAEKQWLHMLPWSVMKLQ